MVKHHIAPDAPGELLSAALQRQGVDIGLPCGGNHSCGKCKVKASGALTPLTPAEACFLSGEEIAAGIRLACFARLLGDAEAEPMAEGAPAILDTAVSGGGRGLQPLMRAEDYGAAIDIGTTTVVCALYGGDGGCLGTASGLNRGRRFGADVISRIDYSIRHSVREIQTLLLTQLEEMLAAVCADCGAPRGHLTHAVVTGNTTMLHFFAGLEAKGIGFAPFTPASLFDVERNDLLAGINCYLPPCFSAYAGADLACCLLTADILRKRQTALLTDIGTNGEMALYHQGRLYCCATAAGPAFEGAGIRHGLAAQEGAICAVRFDAAQKRVAYRTIGDAAARGICGSGLIDAVAVLLEQGAVNTRGRLLANGHALTDCVLSDAEELQFRFPESAVAVTQSDIRHLQLAKGAVQAGMLTLLEYAGIGADALDVCYLCGGFGSYLNLAAAERIGLLLPGLGEKTAVLGNAALAGAARVLLDHAERAELRRIAAAGEYIELSANPRFMEHYLRAMTFEPPGAGAKD